LKLKKIINENFKNSILTFQKVHKIYKTLKRENFTSILGPSVHVSSYCCRCFPFKLFTSTFSRWSDCY